MKAQPPRSARGDLGDIGAEQFFQPSLVASNYSSRLVYRAGGFPDLWGDPTVHCLDLESESEISRSSRNCCPRPDRFLELCGCKGSITHSLAF